MNRRRSLEVRHGKNYSGRRKKKQENKREPIKTLISLIIYIDYIETFSSRLTGEVRCNLHSKNTQKVYLIFLLAYFS